MSAFMPDDSHQLQTTNDPEDAFGYWQRQQAAHLDTLRSIDAHLSKQAPTTTGFEVDLASAPGGGVLFPGGVRLSNGNPIAFAFIENQGAAASISVYAGANGAGGARLLNVLKKATWKCFPIADDITSISLVSSGTDTGAVRVVLTTSRDWAPGQGAAV